MKFFITPLALALLAAPAFAQEKTDTEKRIEELEKKLDSLTKKGEKEKKKGMDLRAVSDKGQLAFESADGSTKFRINGRINIDGAWYSGSQNRLSNGAYVRRARIGYKLTIGTDWVSEGDFDLANNEVAIKDLFVGYKGFENQTIQVGHFKAPFGMDTLGSSKDTWFMERSYSDIWCPDRRIGVAYTVNGKRWQMTMDLFGQEIGENPAESDPEKPAVGVDQGWGAAARFTIAPVFLAADKAIHLGVATAYRRPDADALGVHEIDLSGRPESTKVSKAKFLNLKLDDVDNFKQYGAEFAGVFGAFSWQGEYQTTKVERLQEVQETKKDHSFKTYYGQVSWVFGGGRKYKGDEGLFSSVVPSSKYGAWELGARYSMMDQNDETEIDPVFAGKAKNLTFGLTWHVNQNLKFMLNWTKVDNDQYAKPKSVYGGIPNDDFSFTQARVQMTF